MAKHPILTEQWAISLRRLLKGSSGRVSHARRRRAAGRSVGPQELATQLKPNHRKTPDQQKFAKKPFISAHQQSVDQRKALAKVGTFWSDLFLVRPWLLVCGLWLSFVLMIVIALAGLSSPGRELVLEPVSSSVAGQPLSGPDTAAVSRLTLRDDDIVLTRNDPAATLPGTPEQSMPVWPLLVMVFACAGGCMLMSRPGVLLNDSRRERRRMPGLQSEPRPASARPVVTKNRRGKKNRRLSAQRPAAQVMAVRMQQQKIYHTTPQQRVRVAKPVSFAMDRESTCSVTVVPDGETSPLDWKEGSLAHKLDVRQTRSINSFL